MFLSSFLLPALPVQQDTTDTLYSQSIRRLPAQAEQPE
jgi:hypothetical protein